MKKILTLVILAGLFSFAACGPSAEEKAANEKRIADSVAAADASMKAAEEAAASAAAASIPDSLPKDTVKAAMEMNGKH